MSNKGKDVLPDRDSLSSSDEDKPNKPDMPTTPSKPNVPTTPEQQRWQNNQIAYPYQNRLYF